MKLQVEGIEEIEITDPAGLCNPPADPLPPLSRQGNPIPPNLLPAVNPFPPQPQVPTPFGDPFLPRIPGAGDVAMPHGPPIFTRQIHDPTKWGVGGEAIQRAGEQVDPEKRQKNWQSKMTGEDLGNGNRSTH